MRLPKRHVFPFGYVIKILEITETEMRECNAGVDGCWDSDSRTIFILKSLPMRRKRYILVHELSHALLDYTHNCFDLLIAKP